MERARILFGCYRRGEANDPDQYVASIAAVLSLYDPALIREVTDPRSGISTTEKFSSFMPNSGELKIYCDSISDRRARIARYTKIPAPRRICPSPDTTPGRRANAFYAITAPSYEHTLAWAKTADPADWKLDPGHRPGIWVNWPAFTGAKQIGSWSVPQPRAEAAE